MTPTMPPATVDSLLPQEILDKIMPSIESLLAGTIDAAYQGERVIQLTRLERADFFYRGIQNIAPIIDGNNAGIAWTAAGPDSGPGNQSEANERSLDYNPRKTKSYGDKFVAVLGQRPFENCNAEPSDPKNFNDRRGARQVNLLIQMLQGQWNTRVLNMELFYNLYKNGTTLGYVKAVTDARRFGTYEVPDIQMQDVPHPMYPGGYNCIQCGDFTHSPQPVPSPMCANCGASMGQEGYESPQTVPVPVHQGMKSYPRSSVEFELRNGFTDTWPFNVKKLEKSPWIIEEAQIDKGDILAAHPQARKLVGMSTGGGLGSDSTSTYATTVQAASQSQTGMIRARPLNTWTYRTVWVAPNTLQLIDDDESRAIAMQAFPMGMQVIKVENKTVALQPKDFRDYFSACKPAMSDYLFTDGVCWGILPLEDAWSNLLNIVQETLETGVMRFIVNPDYVDADALNRNRYSPNRFIEALPAAGQSIQSDAILPIPTSDFPQQLPGIFEVIEGLIQNITGLLPQVFGDMPAGLTLGQARMMLNQGLMQLGAVAELAVAFWESTWTNAVKLYCETVTQNPQFKGETIDISLIKGSNWVIKGGASMPRTFAERKESLQELITQNPQLAQMLGIMDPINLEVLTDYLDLPDLNSSPRDMLEALTEIMDQLWQAQPIQPPPPMAPDPTTGQMAPSGPPPPPQPSIPFDGDVFDPQMSAAVARRELLDPGNTSKVGTPGFMNIHAFLKAAVQAMQPQPRQPDPPKLSISMPLDKMPAAVDQATLEKFGISVTPQQLSTTPPPPQAKAAPSIWDQSHVLNRPIGKPDPLPPLDNLPPPNQMIQPGAGPMSIQ